MTREQALMILNHLDVVEHFAHGGEVEFGAPNCRGEFMGWHGCRGNSLLIGSLPYYRPKKSCPTCGPKVQCPTCGKTKRMIDEECYD